MSAADTTSLEPELAGVAWRIASIADAGPIDEVRLLLEEAGLRVDHVERHDEPMIATIERVETRLRALRLVDLPVLRSFNLRRGVDLARRAADAVRRGDGGYMVLTAAKPRPRPRSRLQGKRREEASRWNDTPST